jgi:CDP-glucose 4,6-dehydratase
VPQKQPNILFWQGKRVLITGHTGFKGSWLSLWLQYFGASVFGAALNSPTNPALFDVARVEDGMEHHIVDIINFADVCAVVESVKPDIVFHLAAQPLVRESYKAPLDTFKTNLMGTVNLLEALRSSQSTKAVVNVTSDKCYDNKEWIWGYRETDPMGGKDPYSSSKGCSELITNSYRDSYFRSAGIGLASARAGNVIGGGDWAQDRLLPDILAALSNQKSIEIRNPDATRPWQHVLDPLSGYMMLAERLFSSQNEYSGGWNFGPYDYDVKSVNWVASKICERWGASNTLAPQGGCHPDEALALKLDISKSMAHLNWKPKWGIEEAIDRVVVWHQAWLAGKCMKSLCLSQIEDYLEERK